ncbi:MAG TPA: phage holin family protein [Anaerolineales bacterium]|jgi:putative membrane protein
MQRLLLRWAINALALYLVIGIGLLGGVQAEDTTAVGILLLALIFGLVNALIRPILKLLTCPFILLTLGLFTIVINAFMLWLTGLIGAEFGMAITFDSIWWLVGASLLISIVSSVLTMFLREEMNGR